MYTQCPECGAAFRVTAEVLKQAAGMVRCGSCSHAFNSLAYLSESKPEPKTPDPSIPELVPEPSQATLETNLAAEEAPPETSSGPKAISAEQSAALLKTLDQLAGEDIRIEDTGVEWRVLDDDELDDEPLPATSEHDMLSDPEVTSAFRIEDAPPELAAPKPADLQHTDVFEPGATIVEGQDLFEGHGTMVDELLDEAPTPVDEFLAPEPDDGVPSDMVDLGALIDELEPVDDVTSHEANGVDVIEDAPGIESLELDMPDELDPFGSTVTAEAAPGDDDLEEIELASTPADESWEPESSDEPAADVADTEEPMAAPALEASAEEPVAEEPVAEESVAEEPVAEEPELRFDDNTPLPEDFLDDDGPSVVEPEPEIPAIDSPDPEALQKDLELGKADEWQALLEEFGDLLATDLEPGKDGETADEDWAELAEDAVDAELARELDALEDDDDSEPPEAIETTPDEPPEQAPEEPVEAEAADESAVDVETADDAIAAEAVETAEEAIAAEAVQTENDDIVAVDEVAMSIEAEIESASDEDAESADELAIPELDDSDIPADAPDDETLVAASDEQAEADLDGLPVDDDGALDLTGVLNPDDDGLEDHGESDRQPDEESIPEVLDVGPEDNEPEDQSVEEPGPGHPHYVPPQSEEEQTINMLIDQDLLAIAHEDEEGFTSTIVFEAGADPSDVDSIVMEGDESSSSANDDASRDDQPGESGAESVDGEPDEMLAASGQSAAAPEKNPTRAAGLVALAVILLLALGVQAVHQKRAELATSPSFGSAIMGLYDALGMPVTPEWDVSSWRIEKTQGSTDDSGRLLTIYAQLGNQGDSALPYPTITVSVTDRYQESLGSVIVDPADYLANTAQAASTVAQGASFEATIPIAELSPNAEGYLLNACYRQASGPLRCAKEDFR